MENDMSNKINPKLRDSPMGLKYVSHRYWKYQKHVPKNGNITGFSAIRPLPADEIQTDTLAVNQQPFLL